MGWPRIGKAGVSTRVAGVSFRALDERGVEGSARGAGGSPAGSAPVRCGSLSPPSAVRDWLARVSPLCHMPPRVAMPLVSRVFLGRFHALRTQRQRSHLLHYLLQ
jgi:hypothetical protein